MSDLNIVEIDVGTMVDPIYHDLSRSCEQELYSALMTWITTQREILPVEHHIVLERIEGDFMRKLSKHKR